MKKIITFSICIVFTALAFALIENRALWGYWIYRPMLVNDFSKIDRVVGLSMLEFAANDTTPQIVARSPNAERATNFCSPSTNNECIEGRMLLVLKNLWTVATPEVSISLLKRVWENIQLQGWRAMATDPRYQHSSKPIAGLTVQLETSGQSFFLLAYRTSEISNDRYAYVEFLYKVSGEELIQINQNHFFYEIAGLEALTALPTLWVANAIILFLCSIIWWYLKRLRRTQVSLRFRKFMKI
jgi:hypothetical protein